MKLLKENIRQSTLTQTNMMVKNGLHEKVSFQLRHSRGRGSQEDRTAWAETLREEADWVLGELKDHGGWRSEQGEREIEEGRERRTARDLSGCSYQFGFHSKHSEKPLKYCIWRAKGSTGNVLRTFHTVSYSSCTISQPHQQCKGFQFLHILTNACLLLQLTVWVCVCEVSNTVKFTGSKIRRAQPLSCKKITFQRSVTYGFKASVMQD